MVSDAWFNLYEGANCCNAVERPAHGVRIEGICGLLLLAAGLRQRGRRESVRKCNKIWTMPLSRLHEFSYPLACRRLPSNRSHKPRAEAIELPQGCLSSTGITTLQPTRFQGCYALTTVAMPGCLFLGARLFAECCALERVGVLTENSRRLARGATISPYAFEGCGKLRQIGLPGTKASVDVLSATPPP